jgi:hypothetical protein
MARHLQTRQQNVLRLLREIVDPRRGARIAPNIAKLPELLRKTWCAGRVMASE